MIILDDDTSKPIIDYIYTGDGTDGNPGEIIVTASDESGLSIDPSGTYSVPNSLGTHNFTFTATDNDNDNDRVDDALTKTVEISINIIDDDVIAPVIDIQYIGSGFDGDPGYFEWNVFDIDSEISEINVTISYESTEGLDDYVMTLVGTETGTWNLPPNLGIYTIEISARDNDDDRTLIIDSLTTELTKAQEILDDDVEPPDISNLIIIPDIFEVNISFTAVDYSGINEIKIFINDDIVNPISQNQIGNTYYYTLHNEWLFEKGYSEVKIQVFDADNDRPDDPLSSFITGTFKNVLWDIYEYVDWQIEELKNYIENALDFKWKRCLIHKLTKAQENLGEAFGLIQTNNITRGLCYDFVAKIYLRITEIKTELLNRKNWIPDETADYIITALHNIRNNIVILMGASTGSELAYEIAYLEVELLKFNDYIEQELPYCVGKYLGRKIWCASKLLEIAIFRISEDEEIDCLLRCARWKLERTIHKIDCLLEKGKISEAHASYLKGEILEIITKIESLNN